MRFKSDKSQKYSDDACVCFAGLQVCDKKQFFFQNHACVESSWAVKYYGEKLLIVMLCYNLAYYKIFMASLLQKYLV